MKHGLNLVEHTREQQIYIYVTIYTKHITQFGWHDGNVSLNILRENFR